MAKHIFDTKGRKIGTILDDDELPMRSGCSFRAILICLALVLLGILAWTLIGYHKQQKYFDSFEYIYEKYESQVQADTKGDIYSPYGYSCVVCGNYFERRPGQHFCSKKCERVFYEKKSAWESGKIKK